MTKQTQSLLVLSSVDIEQLLSMERCIELMREALAAYSRGELFQPLRTIIRPENAKGLLALMPAYRSGEQTVYGLKAVAVFPGNPALGKDAHQGCVALFSGETGELQALMNASTITAIRTAAVSAVATDVLANPEANQLTIIGAGVQARTHLTALGLVRQIETARIVSRDPSHARALAVEMKDRVSFPIEAVNSIEEAVRAADIVVTATSSQTPVVNFNWLGEGVHVNAIGTHLPQSRELDTATMARSRIFVDSRESALHEAGDYRIAAGEGAIGPQNIVGEIGEVLNEVVQGRGSAEEITVFKSLGLAVEDMACAEYVFKAAQEQGIGTWAAF